MVGNSERFLNCNSNLLQPKNNGREVVIANKVLSVIATQRYAFGSIDLKQELGEVKSAARRFLDRIQNRNKTFYVCTRGPLDVDSFTHSNISMSKLIGLK